MDHSEYLQKRFDYYRSEGFEIEESRSKSSRDLKGLIERLDDCGR
jgi:hypothetical protein